MVYTNQHGNTVVFLDRWKAELLRTIFYIVHVCPRHSSHYHHVTLSHAGRRLVLTDCLNAEVLEDYYTPRQLRSYSVDVLVSVELFVLAIYLAV